MNQLLLLIGLGVVVYLMNEKNMFKDLSKTFSSGKNTTMLVLLFCGVILFMCMQKGGVREGLCVGDCTDPEECSEENLFYMHPAFDSLGLPTQPDKGKPGFNVCVTDIERSSLKEAIDGCFMADKCSQSLKAQCAAAEGAFDNIDFKASAEFGMKMKGDAETATPTTDQMAAATQPMPTPAAPAADAAEPATDAAAPPTDAVVDASVTGLK